MGLRDILAQLEIELPSFIAVHEVLRAATAASRAGLAFELVGKPKVFAAEERHFSTQLMSERLRIKRHQGHRVHERLHAIEAEDGPLVQALPWPVDLHQDRPIPVFDRLGRIDLDDDLAPTFLSWRNEAQYPFGDHHRLDLAHRYRSVRPRRSHGAKADDLIGDELREAQTFTRGVIERFVDLRKRVQMRMQLRPNMDIRLINATWHLA